MDANGFFYIVDRKKDMILVSGFNVYPNEVEGVVAMHPGCLKLLPSAFLDGKSGEVVKIFVVRKDPSLTGPQVLAHCRENMTGYKIPKYVEFPQMSYPRLTSGRFCAESYVTRRCARG